MMDSLRKFMPGTFQNSIAASAFPDGGYLKCHSCATEQRVTSEDCGVFLAKGWPKCCGRTMTFSMPKKEPKCHV